jgi:aspartate carbamoyltransferase catalytic subunit
MFTNFVSAHQVSTNDAQALIDRAEAFKAGTPAPAHQPVYAANLFFENSTRTHTSFEMAERKLGLTVIPFDPGHSSVTKGETLRDTIKTLAAIGINIAVIRHPEDTYYEQLLDVSPTLAIVNAGDGAGQHPSQMMLDLMTIHEEFGDFTGLKIGIVGDLSHSRVAHSDADMLTRLGAQVMFSGPKQWFSPEYQQFGPYVPLQELVPQVDVLMLLRVQLERFNNNENAAFSKESYHAQYGVTEQLAQTMKPSAIFMHPAPVNRDVELASVLVDGPQSRIFTQMHNGVFMRMAMLEAVMQARHFGAVPAHLLNH